MHTNAQPAEPEGYILDLCGCGHCSTIKVLRWTARPSLSGPWQSYDKWITTKEGTRCRFLTTLTWMTSPICARFDNLWRSDRPFWRFFAFRFLVCVCCIIAMSLRNTGDEKRGRNSVGVGVFVCVYVCFINAMPRSCVCVSERERECEWMSETNY